MLKLGTKAEMSKPSGLYDVFCTQGQGGSIDASYKTLEEAIQHTIDHAGEGCFAIRYPNGVYHEWSDSVVKLSCSKCSKEITVEVAANNSWIINDPTATYLIDMRGKEKKKLLFLESLTRGFCYSGAVFSISCGYGSEFDGTRMFVALCDTCIKKLKTLSEYNYIFDSIGKLKFIDNQKFSIAPKNKT